MKKLIYSIVVLAVGIYIGSQQPVFGEAHPKLVQTTCTQNSNGRALTYFWDDGSGDLFYPKEGGIKLNCSFPPSQEENHLHQDYPPNKPAIRPKD